MPRNTLTKGTFSKGTLFTTADDGHHHDQKGSVIEITCHGNEEVVRISGFAQAIADLDLPSNMIDDSLYFEKTITPKHDKKLGKKASPRGDIVSIIHRGHDYITMCIPLSVISRFELHDKLNSLKWTMKGYSVSDSEQGTVQSEMWFKDFRKN